MKHKLKLMMIIMLLSGCSTFQQSTDNDNQQNNQQPIHVKNTTIENIDRKTGQEIADHLVQLASSVPNVNDATAVVIGNYAVVGIDVNKDLERSDVGSIKYSVAESLKNDHHGARAIVVADADLNARLREVADDIKANQPVQGIMNELADITGRLMPELPSDLIEPSPQKAPEDQKNKLDHKEDQYLDKQQQDQSNQHKEKHE